MKPIGYVNLYQGREAKVWSGRTIFASIAEAKSCPCASRDAYIKTMALFEATEREKELIA